MSLFRLYGVRDFVGSVGRRGLLGADGVPGEKGDTGDPGPTRAKGDTGSTSPAGAKGDTGSTGPAGAKGDTGSPGPAGAKGDTGSTGPAGAKGDTGSPGTADANGDTGSIGPAGDTGIDGVSPGAPGWVATTAYTGFEYLWTNIALFPLTITATIPKTTFTKFELGTSSQQQAPRDWRMVFFDETENQVSADVRNGGSFSIPATQ